MFDLENDSEVSVLARITMEELNDPDFDWNLIEEEMGIRRTNNEPEENDLPY